MSDTGTARRQVFAVFFAIAAALFGTTAITPLWPIYIAGGISELLVTTVFAVYAAAVLIIITLCGPIVRRFRSRTALLIGLLASVIAAVLLITSSSLWALVAARLLFGISGGIYVGMANAFLVSLDKASPSAGRLPAIATAVGLGSGPLVAGFLSEISSRPLVVVWSTDIAILLSAGCILLLAPNEYQPAVQGIIPTVVASRRSAFAAIAPAGFAGFFAFGIISATVPDLFEQFGVRARGLIGLTIGLTFLASASGPLIQRVAHSRATLIGALLVATGLFVLGFAVNLGAPLLIAIAGLLTGVGQGAIIASGLGYLTGGLNKSDSTQMTMSFFAILYVGISIPVVVIGLLNTILPLSLVTTLACAISAVALLAIVIVRHKTLLTLHR